MKGDLFKQLLLWAASFALGLVLAPAELYAQGGDFFTSSPGPLTRSHQSLDNQQSCNDCHVNGDKKVENKKCLGCHDHKNLQKRINEGKGYHSTSKVRGRKCETCHLEHKGRKYDLMGWKGLPGGMKGFDHKLAGWVLKEKHAVLDCKECHKNVNSQGLRTFLGEDKLCGTCHKNDQPHGFEKRSLLQCERCHTESVWKPPKRKLDFDHNKKSDSAFPIVGSHQDVSCTKCHKKAKFNLPGKQPGNCVNCHETDHKGHLFDTVACGKCHSPKYGRLSRFRFNHDRETKFKLGAHSKIKCYGCHTKSLGKKRPRNTCESCHAKENPHRQRFKAYGKPVPKCGTCHPSDKWEGTAFNHNKRTTFDLKGKHAKVSCRKCHRGKKPYDFERFPPAKKLLCMGCHQHKNVHNNEFTDKPKRFKVLDKEGNRIKTCLDCHTTGGSMVLSRKAVNDIHGKTGAYPLLRGHKGVDCSDCHPNDEFSDTPIECGVRCHQDSLHEGRLGDECTRCHDPGRWDATFFDHTEDTTWPLVGLHKKVPKCEDCHENRRYQGTPKNCSAVGCHAKDDAHRGRLGDKCEECHLETGQNIFDHNTQSDYILEGAHLTTKCSECHPRITFVPQPTNCYGCHAEPKIHRGQYGTVCERCHNTSDFRDIKPLHDIGAFSLTGQHDQIPCERCHKDNRALAGTGNFCINCHRQDDIHSNSLSPKCGECHTQWSFAPARFDHGQVGCNLTGLHRTLACYDCHQTGNFRGLSPNCYGCHVDEALATTSFNHAGLTTCGTCHNPNFFAPAQGANAFGRESICR